MSYHSYGSYDYSWSSFLVSVFTCVLFPTPYFQPFYVSMWYAFYIPNNQIKEKNQISHSFFELVSFACLHLLWWLMQVELRIPLHFIIFSFYPGFFPRPRAFSAFYEVEQGFSLKLFFLFGIYLEDLQSISFSPHRHLSCDAIYFQSLNGSPSIFHIHICCSKAQG